MQEQIEIEGDEPEVAGSGGAAADREEPEAPNARRRFLPSSVGHTVLLPPDVNEVEALVTRAAATDYRTREGALSGPSTGDR